MKTWDVWKDALRNAWYSSNYTTTQQIKNYQRRLKPTEDFAAYFRDKLHLQSYVYPVGTPDHVLIEDMLRGSLWKCMLSLNHLYTLTPLLKTFDEFSSIWNQVFVAKPALQEAHTRALRLFIKRVLLLILLLVLRFTSCRTDLRPRLVRFAKATTGNVTALV
jgi:hypothetical protein